VNDRFARTPEPPYYVVVFTSQRNGADPEGYAKMAEAMANLAPSQPGYLGFESTRDEAGFGITLSYWASEEAIAAWKRVAAHREAQRTGHSRWYEDFITRVARVERDYSKATSPREGL
jgi:heme-degrading monooxygenase HmoA